MEKPPRRQDRQEFLCVAFDASRKPNTANDWSVHASCIIR